MYVFFLLILVITGFFFRMHNLGYYSLFASDDALTVFGIKSILKYGYSVFPSGLLYPKELLFSYPAAGLSKIFGANEFSFRLFNVPFSLGVIVLTYFLGKELCDRKTGLLAAFIMTLATWNLEFVRYIRSYCLLQFLVILSIYLFYKAFVKGEHINKFLIFVFFALTVFTSPVGTVILVLFFALWIVKGKDFFKPKTIIFGVGFVLITVFWFQFYESLVTALRVKGLSEKVSLLGVIQKVPLPDMRIFSNLLANHALLWYGVAVFYVLVSIYFVRRYSGRYLLPIVTTLFLLFDLPEAGLMFFCAYTIIKKYSLKDFKDKPIIASLLIFLAGSCFWFAYGLLLWRQGVYQVITSINIVKFPSMVYYLYLYEPFPKMTVITIIGLVILYFRAIANKDRDKSLFLGALFMGAIIFLPLFWQRSHPRYNFPIYPIFILIYSFVILEAVRYATRFISKNNLFNKPLKIIVFTILLFLTLEHASIREAYHVVNVVYGEPVIHPYLATSHRVTHYFDYKGMGSYVNQHMGKDDIIITAFDRLALYTYIGRIDYSVYFPEPTAHVNGDFFVPGDPYINNGGICSMGALKNFMSNKLKEGKAIWIVTPNYSLLGPQQEHSEVVAEHTKLYHTFFDFLNRHKHQLVFTSKDNLIQAYKFTKKEDIE